MVFNLSVVLRKIIKQKQMIKNVVIFLDFDGVLLSWNQSIAQKINWDNREGVIFDKNAVMYLNQILHRYDAKIVISSTWALGGLDSCIKILENNKIDCTRLHEDWVTPRKISSSRKSEILFWLDENKVDSWLVLDDDPTVTVLPQKHVVWVEEVNKDSCLRLEHYNQAIEKLDKLIK